MTQICVITGGGSGMGLAAAGFLDRDKTLVLAGRTAAKLERAKKTLEDKGYTAAVHTADTGSRESVEELASFAASLGSVQTVIHAAGISPAMGSPEQILRTNALGTVYVNRAFASLMPRGSVIVDVASSSAYALPKILVRKGVYRLAETQEEKFLKKSLRLAGLAHGSYMQSGFAYAISKNFTVWYAQKCAFELGSRGIRVVSISPGLVATDRGKREADEGSSALVYGAEQRMGTPEELGFAIASLADARNGYLAGADVLCDGGCTNGKAFRRN